MSFGGHVMDMVNRIKHNRANRPSNRAKFKENNRKGIYSSKNGKKMVFKTVPEDELDKIKSDIRAQAEMRKRKERNLYLVFGVIALILFMWILFWVD